MPSATTSLLRLATLATVLFVLAATASAGPLVQNPKCPKQHGQLAGDSDSNLWHKGTSLYGCATAFGGNTGNGKAPPGRTYSYRLGPWAPSTKIAPYHNDEAVWTVPETVNGVRTDRVWAASVQNGKRWLSGTRLVPQGAGQPFKDGRVQRLLQVQQGAAWVTTKGDVVIALRQPDDKPMPVGTPPHPLAAVKQLTLVGSFPDSPVAALAASATFKVNGGDGDECGGSDDYTLSVKLDASGPVVGAKWAGDWIQTNPLSGC